MGRLTHAIGLEIYGRPSILQILNFKCFVIFLKGKFDWAIVLSTLQNIIAQIHILYHFSPTSLFTYTFLTVT
jgi:hypothetical protein